MMNSIFTYLDNIYTQMLHFANRLSPQQWVMMLTLTLVVGVLCMRGFGSRSNY
jgi:hypothetical protein